MKLASKNIKIKRLIWQIQEMKSMKSNPTTEKGIERRLAAIEHLKIEDISWEKLQRVFGFNYWGWYYRQDRKKQ